MCDQDALRQRLVATHEADMKLAARGTAAVNSYIAEQHASSQQVWAGYLQLLDTLRPCGSTQDMQLPTTEILVKVRVPTQFSTQSM